MNVNRLLLPLAILTLASGCGKSNSDAGFPLEETSRITPLDGSNINGLYMATLMTINPSVNGDIPGTVIVHREGEKFQVKVKITGGGSGVMHKQSIHIGTRCPIESDDQNGDGLIDIVEGDRIWGKVIIPLDSDLSSQGAGRNRYPQANDSGNYFYNRFANFDTLFNDLKAADQDANDQVMKLSPGQGLDLVGKVVVIHGAARTANLPDTIASRDSMSANKSFPIACGEFVKVTKIPDDMTGQNSSTVGESDVEPRPRPEPTPIPTPTPTPDPDPEPNPEPNPDPQPEPENPPRSENESEEEWYDRLSDWWRRRF